MREAQRAAQTDFSSGPKEGRRGDRQRSQGKGRARQSRDETKDERFLRAIAFLRQRFSDEHLGDDVTAYDATRAITTAVGLLFNLPDAKLEAQDEVLVNQGYEFIPELDDLVNKVRQRLLSN